MKKSEIIKENFKAAPIDGFLNHYILESDLECDESTDTFTITYQLVITDYRISICSFAFLPSMHT